VNQSYALVANRDIEQIQDDGSIVSIAKGAAVNSFVWNGEDEYAIEDGFVAVIIEPGWGVVDGHLQALPAAVEPEPEPAPVLLTYKSDVWRRATDAEAEIINAALNAAPVRQRRLWDDSTILEHGADMWTPLRAQMVEAFGEARANEILAPSI
jgi:hypothetical protein